MIWSKSPLVLAAALSSSSAPRSVSSFVPRPKARRVDRHLFLLLQNNHCPSRAFDDFAARKSDILSRASLHVPTSNNKCQRTALFSTVNENIEDLLIDGSFSDDNDEDDETQYDEESTSESSTTDAAETTTSRGALLHQTLRQAVNKSLNSLEKKNASLQRELDKAENLEATMSRANLIISNLYRMPPGTTSLMVEDWDNGGDVVELQLNTDEYGSPQEEADALFARARKMKRGSAVIKELMDKSVEAEEVLRDAMMDLDTAASSGEVDEGIVILIQERLERTSSKTGFKMPDFDKDDNIGGGRRDNKNQKRQRSQQRGGSNAQQRRREPTYRHLTSPSGLKVLVGRNRRDNEAICFQAARGDDVWFHARGCPGAHVLLQVRRGNANKPTSDDLQFCANLAAFYSDARTERKTPVTTAEPKHIQKPRGAPPGAVKLRQEGPTLQGRPEDVPEDLKAAREESGVAWDEMGYRRDGVRAKNKKRTAAVEKQNQAKRRADKKEKKKRRQAKQDGDGDFY